jgi:hypothetical protein
MASFFLVSVAILCALMFFIISNFELAKGSLYDGVLLLRLNFWIGLLGIGLLVYPFSVSLVLLFEESRLADCELPLGIRLGFLAAPASVP